MNSIDFENKINEYTSKGIPYFFTIDFELEKAFVCKCSDAAKNNIFFNIKGNKNYTEEKIDKEVHLDYHLLDYHLFNKKFNLVTNEINKGESFLLNLTFPTEIGVNLSLKEIFQTAQAPYKLLFQDKFVVFSPESFIQIKGDDVFTFPMKGTIASSVPNAEDKLLNNNKEMWEHNTIVDLMRNDLAIIAKNITVDQYRYVEKISTHKGDILQTSSRIKGTLPKNWRQTFGTDLLKLLPAGSISGAPKEKTVEIIQNVELDKRGFYTGVFGLFDGQNLESAVSIRFIEESSEGKKIFRTGAGITSHSIANEEYEELKHKIYIPKS